jgi:phosphatidylserine/phosphatidylglycerophosphate/cardiolipin synthase-like enzyme
MHAKFIATDVASSSRKAAVSSVNYSHTSFTRNREAGAIMSGAGAAPLIQFLMDVFDADFDQGLDVQVNQTYSKSEMDIITKTDTVKVIVPGPPTDSRYYVTPVPSDMTVVSDVTITASPDYAQDRLVQDMKSATSTLAVHMYQITDPTLCNLVQQISTSGINVTLLVSSRIYDATDCASANTCYSQLLSAGMTIQKTPYYYEYSHQKVWIADGTRVGWSTGNWSPSDYPVETSHPMVYPPPGDGGWRIANRDYTVHVNDAKLASVFQTVMTQDYVRGDSYTSTYPVTCGFT